MIETRCPASACLASDIVSAITREVVESKDPEVIYVPSYSPTVVYGPPAYPAYPYPPIYYPYYPPGAALVSFGIGMMWGAAIWGGDHVVHALATAAGIAHHPLPSDGAAWVATAHNGDQLIVSEAAGDALREGDVVAWRSQLEAGDAQWLQPLLAGVRNGEPAELAIAACNRDDLLETTVTRTKLRRFWRRARPLATYATHA